MEKISLPPGPCALGAEKVAGDAPKLFNAVADALEWCVARQGIQHIYHYLDDLCRCSLGFTRYGRVWCLLEYPAKGQSGATGAGWPSRGAMQTFLGIKIDTISQEL